MAAQVQKAFSGKSLRAYTSPDVIGVEVGAALKNVDCNRRWHLRRPRLGSNTRAALITRGLAEIRVSPWRWVVKHEPSPGLAGLGDLVLTTTGICREIERWACDWGAANRSPPLFLRHGWWRKA